MTNAQKWVAGFLLLFVIFFVLGKITEDDGTTTSTEQYMGEQQGQQEEDSKFSEEQQSGLTLIKNNGCTSCHGNDLKGTNLAPSLYTAGKYWDRDGLINYLRNPSDFSGEDRFEELKQKYNNTIMPSYGNLNVKDLGKMADYILSLEEGNN